MPRRSLFAALVAVALVGLTPAASAATDPALKDQWGMEKIGAPAAWGTGTGAGITIAVVDTGVDLTHEDLAAKVVPGRNFIDPGRPPQDDHGHGTHVAGIAAAATNNGKGVAGTAPGARILPVKVLDSGGGGSSDVISQGIRWAAGADTNPPGPPRAQVINLSIGPDVALLGSLFGTGLDQAVNDAWARGVVVVVAAGNDALFNSSYSNVHALVVTATTRDDEAAGYASGVGRAPWGLAAPGGDGGTLDAGDIVSTFWPNSYRYLAGTSMAAPHVAGAAAVLRGMGLSPQQTVDRLLATAKDIGPAGPDSTFGSGLVDMAKAVTGRAAGEVTATTPAGGTSATGGGGAGGGSTGGSTPAASGGTSTGGTRAPSSGGGSGGTKPRPAPAPPTTASLTTTTVPPPPVVEALPLPPTPVARARVPDDEAAARAGSREADGDETPWLPLVLATAALAGAAGGLVRLRRSRPIG